MEKAKEIMKRMEEKIAEWINQGDSESAIKLLPIDIAWVMGHDNIVVLLEGVDPDWEKSNGRFSVG